MRAFVERPPAAEPITVAEAANWLRLDADAAEADTNDVARLITAAREYVEQYCDRAFAAQTWVVECDRLAEMQLPGGPVAGVDGIRYIDDHGADADVSAEVYKVTRDGRIRLRPGHRWPAQTLEPAGVSITYRVGDDAVPMDVQQAMRLLIAHWYEHRQAIALGAAANEIPLGVESLLTRHREMRL